MSSLRGDVEGAKSAGATFTKAIDELSLKVHCYWREKGERKVKE